LSPSRTFSLAKIQVAGWIALYLINVFVLLQISSSETFMKAAVSAFTTIFFYIITIYANVHWFIPSFYERRRYKTYVISVALFFLSVVALQMWINHEVRAGYFGESYYDYSFKQWMYVSFSVLLVLIISGLFHATLAFFSLRKKQQSLEAQHLHAQLELLKSQVHPHFLFNTLNNIYYEARQESPRAASLIEKLSLMMRYLVEETKHERVDLVKELAFLENYIALEQIRLRYPLQMTFTKEGVTHQQIPPMLLVPIVENIFKHGIDKKKPVNTIRIMLIVNDNTLHFNVSNPLPFHIKQRSTGGFGLKNLQQRLDLLYVGRYQFKTTATADEFITSLTIPLT
jgi:sensor histidine kinase YesM